MVESATREYPFSAVLEQLEVAYVNACNGLSVAQLTAPKPTKGESELIENWRVQVEELALLRRMVKRLWPGHGTGDGLSGGTSKSGRHPSPKVR